MKLSPRTTATFTLGLLTAAVLAGCATTAPSEQAPSPAVSVDRQAAGLMCDPAGIGDCGIGDIGPGGGVVFYDAGSVQPWGRFLEAGPALARTEWCDDSTPSVAGTKEWIGSGKKNTELIADACRSGAANTVSDYDGGGKNDWFLPSKDELNELYKQRDSVGGFEKGYYWSSSQYGADAAWLQLFTNGNQDGSDKDGTLGVRPVRAF